MGGKEPGRSDGVGGARTRQIHVGMNRDSDAPSPSGAGPRTSALVSSRRKGAHEPEGWSRRSAVRESRYRPETWATLTFRPSKTPRDRVAVPCVGTGCFIFCKWSPRMRRQRRRRLSSESTASAYRRRNSINAISAAHQVSRSAAGSADGSHSLVDSGWSMTDAGSMSSRVSEHPGI